MSLKNRKVNTEDICKSCRIIENIVQLKYLKSSIKLKETITMKKVGQPTLVMTKIQNYKKDEAVKKAGQSTLVIKHKKSAKSIKKAGQPWAKLYSKNYL